MNRSMNPMSGMNAYGRQPAPMPAIYSGRSEMKPASKPAREQTTPGCTPQETCLNNVQLAVAYVPFQKYCSVMSPMESLVKGTAFEELYSPYSKREFGKLEPELTSRNCGDDGGNQYGKR